jgi:predicted MFS family arabinose efflux permease
MTNTTHAVEQAAAASAMRPWLVVLGSALALTVCNGPIILFTFGVLVGPITSEFGWPRATLASAVVAAHATGALVMPFIGGLMDRFGVRHVTLPAILAFALVLAGISALPGVPWMFVLAYAVLGLVGAGHSTLPYARAVSTWFDRKRGLALGLTLAGVGIGIAVMPQVARLLVGAYGWRGAYVGLAIVLFIVAAPAVAAFVRDCDHEASGEERRGAESTDGLPLGDALRTARFWAIGFALLLVAAAVNGTIAHIVPLLADRGVATERATAALSVTGFALIFGRVISGYCLDRFFAPYVSAAFFVVPLCGIVLLAAGATGPLALVAAVLLGVGIGAEVDIMAFLTGRYFGLAHYGAIYGGLLALFTLGSGLGPWLIALAFDHLDNYQLAQAGAGVALFAAAVLVVRLGPYRYR